jgi:hypothetical protein
LVESAATGTSNLVAGTVGAVAGAGAAVATTTGSIIDGATDALGSTVTGVVGNIDDWVEVDGPTGKYWYSASRKYQTTPGEARPAGDFMIGGAAQVGLDDWQEITSDAGAYWYSASRNKVTAVGASKPEY